MAVFSKFGRKNCLSSYGFCGFEKGLSTLASTNSRTVRATPIFQSGIRKSKSCIYLLLSKRLLAGRSARLG